MLIIAAAIIFISLKSLLTEIVEEETDKIYSKISEIDKFNEDIKALRLELLKVNTEQEVKNTIEFFEIYLKLKSDFDREVDDYNIELDKKLYNIDDLKSLTQKRIKSSEDFKNKLLLIEYIPKPLIDFYNLSIEFLENDIKMLKLIISYYEDKSYSTYDDTEIKQLKTDNILLVEKIEAEKQKIFEEYEISFLIND